ncbi:nitrite/sulfite reductase [Caminibacter mediatlanticus]|uniref:Nitrite reductase (NAD(P)H) large subunit n=1 Tax=Caminibacter mediatlanticus TB-2 TaxID=391592 RepID=A0AAI9F2G7_9BACT|nr:nitrite/sulfite reductase [Caminibacter mediatlanticus]EDM23735.1 nitrite reductase (NAD(P)H) large subunit [Caminibacter mediatlanticus TB-2]
MIEKLQEAYNRHSKKINKIEKIKQESTPFEALERLKENKLLDIDRSFFLKCFGCFYKDNTDDYMIRVRIKDGTITPNQAKKIGKIAKEFGNDYIDLTTRSQIEFRFIKEENLYQVLQELESVGIVTYQTGVDNFRGILTDPFSGISVSNILDDRVLREKLEEEFLAKKDEVCALPRKFNIGICGNYNNTSNVFTQDLGFALAKKDGEYGYRVFMGGRVGMIGKDSNIFVNTDKAVLLFRGVKELFKKYGFRDNRNKNRFIFLLREVGLENFIKALEEYLDYEFKKGGELLTDIKINTHLKEELKNGKVAYKFIVPAGIFSGSDMIKAGELAQNYEGVIKLSFDQNFFITNADDSIEKSELYKKYSPNPARNYIVACAGIKTCKFGVIENKEDAINLSKDLENEIKEDGVIKFHWSACVKGCGIHGVGDFGFEGAKIKTNEGMKLGVHIFVGGRSNREGKKVLSVPLDEVKNYVLPMIQMYNKSEGLTYEEWFIKSNITEWAAAFIMKFNAKYFEFLPSLPLKSNKIEMFEIKELGNSLFYKIAGVHGFDDLFNPSQVKSLKEFGYKDEIHKVIDNMVAGKYQVWSEVLAEI